MRKVWVITKREYAAAVRTKAFLISLIIMPIMMGGSVLAQVILRRFEVDRDRKILVIDRTPGQSLASKLVAAAEERNKTKIIDSKTNKKTEPAFALTVLPPAPETPAAIDEQRLALSMQVQSGEYAGIVEIGKDVFTAAAMSGAESDDVDEERAVRFQAPTVLARDVQRWVELTVNRAVMERRVLESGLSSIKLASILTPVPIVARGLSKRDDAGTIHDGSSTSQSANVLAPFGLSLLMFMLLMVGAQPLLQGVVEEKMQRVAEVLLGSVRPFELMLGKLIGMVGVSLTLGSIYLAGAYWAASKYELTEYLSATVLVWFFAFQVLAVLMYGAMFIAVGSAASDLRETQTLVMPLMLVIVLPMFVLANVVREPHSTFSVSVSLIPLASPMLLVARHSVPPGVPIWQLALGIIMVLGTTVLFVYAAGRVFRVGILMQGKGARFADIGRWILRG